MISSCYVHITLPDKTTPVVAGLFRMENAPTGVIGTFVHAKSYLARSDCVDIDPVELKLGEKPLRTGRMNGIFGALRDSAPDSWGRKVIDHRLGPQGSEINYLLNCPDDRAGALSFGMEKTSPAASNSFNGILDLPVVMRIADELANHDADPSSPKPEGPEAELVERLTRAGTSMGGARPKATIQDDGALWMAKFPHRDDKWNNPLVEHAVMRLAGECGLAVAETKMVAIDGKDVVFVKRFDRLRQNNGQWLRSRMISGLTLLKSDESDRSRWSYVELGDEMKRLSKSGNRKKQLRELFHRICFNAMVSNVDDHPRNHAFLNKRSEWTLSPAYDLTPTPMISMERRDLAMSFGDWGRWANETNLLSQCERFDLAKEDASAIIREMSRKIETRWYSLFKECGVSERNCDMIKSAFLYDGFSIQPPDDEKVARTGQTSFLRVK